MGRVGIGLNSVHFNSFIHKWGELALTSQKCWYTLLFSALLTYSTGGITANTINVLSRGHLSSCVSTPSYVHSQDGGRLRGLQLWSITEHWCWVSSYYCLASSISSKTLSLLLGLVSELLFFYAVQSLLLQKTTSTLTVEGSICSQPQQESSMSAILFLCTLPTVHHTLPSFFHWLRHISPPSKSPTL